MKKITRKELEKIYKLRTAEGFEEYGFQYKKTYLDKLYDFLKQDLEGFSLYKVYNVHDVMNDLAQVFILPEDFMAKYRYALNWNIVCTFQPLSEDFILTMNQHIKWETLCEHTKTLSEDFIRKYTPTFFDKKAWYALCLNRNIRFSESFMREMNDYINWNNIGDHQKFSKDFIRENAHQLRYSFVHGNKLLDIPKEEMKEFTSKYEPNMIWFIGDLKSLVKDN